jgi:putative membrane protein
MRHLRLLVALALFAAPAFAHPGRAPQPHDLWTVWSAEPLVLLGLGLGAWVYARGVETLWRRAGVGRGIRRGQVLAYAGGLCTLALALLTPVDTVGGALFSVHMVQHLLLVGVAAPLLVLGAPLLGAVWALPRGGRRVLAHAWRRVGPLRTLAHALASPASAWLLHAAALWAWHVPSLYDAAVESEWVHTLEHLSFLGTALLFWGVVLHPAGQLRHVQGVGVLYVFTFAMQSGILGALLTFSERPWYAAHLGTTRAWGVTPLEDQQLAGVVMWAPGGLIYLLVLGALFMEWLQAAERRVRLREAGTDAGAGTKSAAARGMLRM